MTTTEHLTLVNEALIAITKMDDTDTCDEQFDCIEVLCKLRSKLERKKEATE